MPQSVVVPKPDFLGHYESLSKDWPRLCEWLGLDILLLRRVNASAETERYYTPCLVDLVIDYYKSDFEIYGYGAK